MYDHLYEETMFADDTETLRAYRVRTRVCRKRTPAAKALTKARKAARKAKVMAAL